MYKGPEREIDAIFTGPSSAVCGVSLDINDKKEYLITGTVSEPVKPYMLNYVLIISVALGLHYSSHVTLCR